MRRLSRAQVREIDRRSIEQFHIPGIVLMENAARAVVKVALDMLQGVGNPSALIVGGGGNNGGDGLAVARHLHNRGARVELLLAVDPERYTGDARINWDIVHSMAIACSRIEPVSTGNKPDLIIDALFGTGLSSPPRESWQIDWMNRHNVPILAIDVPSGMDCDTGEPLGGACVRATRTVTFVAEKIGFANPLARQYLGEVTVGDIGCPRELIDAVASGAAPAEPA